MSHLYDTILSFNRKNYPIGLVIGDGNIIVDFAMRYGNPSIKSKLTFLKKKGVKIS